MRLVLVYLQIMKVKQIELILCLYLLKWKVVSSPLSYNVGLELKKKKAERGLYLLVGFVCFVFVLFRMIDPWSWKGPVQ